MQRFELRDWIGSVLKLAPIIQELLNGSPRTRTGVLLAGWGFVATLSLLLAVGAYQNRVPDPFRTAYGGLPLPPGGAIETTAGIGSAGTYDVFANLPAASNARNQRLDAELETLRQEIIALRRSADALRRQNELVSGRLNELENGSGGAVPTSRSAGLGPPSAVRPAPGRRNVVADIAPNVTDPIVTGSIQRRVEAPGDAAPRSEFGIDLGRYPSLGDVQSAWAALRTTEEEIIAPLVPLAAVTEIDGTMQARLVAGPFANAAAAAAACARLGERRIDCQPTLYAGQQLTLR